MIKNKSVSIKVHPRFYDEIEKKRKEFMKKNDLNRLSTVAFTGILGGGYGTNEKSKKKRRR